MKIWKTFRHHETVFVILATPAGVGSRTMTLEARWNGRARTIHADVTRAQGTYVSGKIRTEAPDGTISIFGTLDRDGFPERVANIYFTPGAARAHGPGSRIAEEGDGEGPGTTTLARVMAAQRFERAADVTRVRRAFALLLHEEQIRTPIFMPILALLNADIDREERRMRQAEEAGDGPA